MFPPLSRVIRPGALLAALLVLGCGPSPQQDESKPDAQVADQKKIQELSKKGYNLKEIRAIMKGEKPEPEAPKKASHGRR